MQSMTSSTRTALIMEGGAMRGMFTSGVMDVLMEHGISFDGAAGISAGAVFGCNYKSKQIGRAVRYNKKYSYDKRYCSLRSLLTTGDLYGADFCYRELPDVLDPFDRATFRSNPMEFYVGATNVMTGETEYHKCVDGEAGDIRWMQASASMPLVSKPVAIDGLLLLDGGIADPVPYKFMESMGFNRNLIILTQPVDYVKKKSHILPLLRIFLHRYPNIRKAMAVRHLRYNQQMREIAQREKLGISFVIRPPKSLNIGRIERNPDELERVYQIGRVETLRQIAEIQSFLKNETN